jgi:hypothetical protein
MIPMYGSGMHEEKVRLGDGRRREREQTAA